MQYVCMSFSKVTMVVYSFLSNFGNVTMVVYFFLGLFLKKELLVDLLWSLISPWSFIIFYWKKHGWSFISPWSFIYFQEKFHYGRLFPPGLLFGTREQQDDAYFMKYPLAYHLIVGTRSGGILKTHRFWEKLAEFFTISLLSRADTSPTLAR